MCSQNIQTWFVDTKLILWPLHGFNIKQVAVLTSCHFSCFFALLAFVFTNPASFLRVWPVSVTMVTRSSPVRLAMVNNIDACSRKSSTAGKARLFVPAMRVKIGSKRSAFKTQTGTVSCFWGVSGCRTGPPSNSLCRKSLMSSHSAAIPSMLQELPARPASSSAFTSFPVSFSWLSFCCVALAFVLAIGWPVWSGKRLQNGHDIMYQLRLVYAKMFLITCWTMYLSLILAGHMVPLRPLGFRTAKCSHQRKRNAAIQ